MTTLIGHRPLVMQDLHEILYKDSSVDIHEDALQRVQKSYQFLKQFAKDKLIYGINTGFGPMAQYRINDEQQVQLQYNLIRSHASGLGKPVDAVFVKALMVARLNTLLRGMSGVHPELVSLLQTLINRNILPVVFEHGSVGASGDLVQLAHLALALIGEGEVWWQGKRARTQDVFAAEGITPFQIRMREGLALMNGTSAMTGIGIVNLLHAHNLFNWNLAASGLLVELVESYDDFYSPELNEAKFHPGQRHVAKSLNQLLIGSQLVRKRKQHLYDQKVTDHYLTEKVQEYYSIRCIPQILGPIYDTILQAEAVLINEINSVNDNPLVDAERADVYHGGNFHGDYVALEMDKLKTTMTKLSMLTERQLNFLLNNKLNQKLPPFVNLGTLGLNLGMQGTQFVATSTVAESQTYSFPMYVHSIPNNNDNQDIVSMGTNAALITSKVIENTYQVLAVQLLTLLQATDYLAVEEKLSPSSKALYQEFRSLVPVFAEDGVMYEKTTRIVNQLRENWWQSPATETHTFSPERTLENINV